MTRGPSWDAYELQIAARAFKIATTNRIKGADQAIQDFSASILRSVIETQPHDLQDTNLRCGNRAGRDCILRNLKKTVFPDISKYQKRLKSIKTKQPTGNLIEKDVHCMAIANHLNMCHGINYDYCTFGSKSFNPVTTWKYYLAFLEVCHLKKFDPCPQKSIIEMQNENISMIERAAQFKKRANNVIIDDNNDSILDSDDDNLPIQLDNDIIDSDDDENNENVNNQENILIPQNVASISQNAASINYHAPAVGNANITKAAKGIKKA
jgi:hypothetical protein